MTDSELKLNNIMPEVIPGLKGMKGGEKQHWINANLDFIALLNEHYGFESTRKALGNMKAETLIKALQKSEGKSKLAVTKAEQAFNQAYLANERFYALQPEVERISEQLGQHSDGDQQLRQMLADFFQLQSKLNGMAAQLIEKQSQNISNLHNLYSHNDICDVDLTLENLQRNGIKAIKAGPTSGVKRGRLDVSNDTRISAGDAGDDVIKAIPGNHPGIGNKMTGKGQTSRPVGRQRITNRERYTNAVRRCRRV